MITWDSSFETVPANTDSISAGADVIRTLKSAIRERVAKDHYMDLAGDSQDHGEHSRVTFHEPLDETPTTEDGKGVLFTQEVDGRAELHWKDEEGTILAITSQGELTYTPGSGTINPPGSAVAFMGATPPEGWLECNGAAVSRTTFASLFTVISTMYGHGDGSTTFNLPDLRGYFLRGWDHGVGRDPDSASRTDRGDGTTGDNVGTIQDEELKSHAHSYSQSEYIERFDGNKASATVGTTASTSSVGGNETRPMNVAVMYCIKT